MKRLTILLLVAATLSASTTAATASGLILGGELSNSAVTCIEDIDQVMPRMKALGLNTVLTPVYWEFIEPEEAVSTSPSSTAPSSAHGRTS